MRWKNFICVVNGVVWTAVMMFAECNAQQPYPSEFSSGYNARRDSVIDFFLRSNKTDFMTIMIRLSKRKAVGRDFLVLDSLISNPTADMFWMYKVTALYLHGKKSFSDSLAAKIRKAFVSYPAYRGDTENHWLMYYASLYLFANEVRSDSLRWFNGKTTAENISEAESWLEAFMKKTFTDGFTEFDSPQYGAFYLIPLILLHDFSTDNAMKLRAKIMLYRLLVDYLADYHFGVMTGGCSRVIDRDIFDKKSTQMALLLGFYLGDKPLFDKDGSQMNLHSHMVILALSEFAFPEILHQLYAERQTAEKSIERHRLQTVIRYFKEPHPRVDKYSWSTPEYSLGSVYEDFGGMIQQRTWSLDWKSSKNNAQLFGLHPYFSEESLAALFPGPKEIVFSDVVAQRPTYRSPDKWIGASPYERLFQNENVMMGLYDFPDSTSSASISFFLSNDIDSMKASGNSVWARAGDIYFVLHFSSRPEITPTMYGDRYRVSGDNPGFVLEVLEKQAASTLRGFHSEMSPEQVVFLPGRINYTSFKRKNFSLVLAGTRDLNETKRPSAKSRIALKNNHVKIAGNVMTIKTSVSKLSLNMRTLKFRMKGNRR